MRLRSTLLSSLRTVDVLESDLHADPAGVLLFHGSGNAERLTLRSLGVALAERGARVLLPDWIPSIEEEAASDIVDFALADFEQQHIPPNRRTVIGWSAGAAIALQVAGAPNGGFTRCVTLSSGVEPADAVATRLSSVRDLELLVLHGSDDEISSPEASRRLERHLAAAGVSTGLVIIDGGSHADLVCATYEPGLEMCIPAGELSSPMLETVEHISSFVRRAGS